MPTLVLASTSRYRRELLARFGLPFDTSRPEVDETPQPASARTHWRPGWPRQGAVRSPPASTTLPGDRLRPGRGSRAACWASPADPQRRDRAITGDARPPRALHTSIALANADGRVLEALDLTEVAMRDLDDGEIARYVDAEQLFDCAGSFKGRGPRHHPVRCHREPRPDRADRPAADRHRPAAAPGRLPPALISAPRPPAQAGPRHCRRGHAGAGPASAARGDALDAPVEADARMRGIAADLPERGDARTPSP